MHPLPASSACDDRPARSPCDCRRVFTIHFLRTVQRVSLALHHPLLVAQSCKASLERLGLTYVDLYLIHAPFFSTLDKGNISLEQVQRACGLSAACTPQLPSSMPAGSVQQAVASCSHALAFECCCRSGETWSLWWMTAWSRTLVSKAAICMRRLQEGNGAWCWGAAAWGPTNCITQPHSAVPGRPLFRHVFMQDARLMWHALNDLSCHDLSMLAGVSNYRVSDLQALLGFARIKVGKLGMAHAHA